MTRPLWTVQTSGPWLRPSPSCVGSNLRVVAVAASAEHRTLAFAPAEFGLAAHPCAGSDGQRAGLQVADHHTRSKQIDVGRFLDVAFELAGNRHLVGANAARQLGARFDREIALDADVALELAGDAYAAAAFDL